MTVKFMRIAMPLVLMACLVMTAGAALTSLPDSSHYSGTSYYTASPTSGKIQTGRVEFAVYDTQANPNEFVGTDGFTNPGTGRYIYAYQIFNYSSNDYGMTNTSIPYFVIKSLGANALASNADIDTANDKGTNSINATAYSLNASKTSLVFAFDGGVLAAGKNSWYLIMSSEQDWVVGNYSIEAPKDDEIPLPDGTKDSNTGDDNTTVPEPVSMLLMGLGAVALYKRKQK